MHDLHPQAVTALLAFPLFLSLAGAGMALVLVYRARAIVGPVFASDRPRRALRLALFAGIPLCVLVMVLVLGDLPRSAASVCMVLSAWIGLRLPGFQDAICGERGVQRGFHARRYAELEEWRLTGEHLRFRLFGEWTSVPVPPEKQALVRATLVREAGDRESQFKD
jgi:hypothetical protein